MTQCRPADCPPVLPSLISSQVLTECPRPAGPEQALMLNQADGPCGRGQAMGPVGRGLCWEAFLRAGLEPAPRPGWDRPGRSLTGSEAVGPGGGVAGSGSKSGSPTRPAPSWG